MLYLLFIAECFSLVLINNFETSNNVTYKFKQILMNATVEIILVLKMQFAEIQLEVTLVNALLVISEMERNVKVEQNEKCSCIIKKLK